MGHFFGNLMGIFCRSQIGRQTFTSVVEADQAEADEDKDASEPVASQDGRRA